MPFMTHGASVEYSGEKEPTEKVFLSHFEGQWYFLHRIEPDKEPDNGDNPATPFTPDYRIVSLAEGEAKHVRVRPNPPRASRIAPLPWGLGMPPLRRGVELSSKHCKHPSLEGWESRLWSYLWNPLELSKNYWREPIKNK
jgi:hypothetical protein